MARISHEAHVLARVAGEHVVRLLDAGWTATVGPYLVLEHLEGADLARLLEEHGPLPPALAVDYVLQACDALAGSHAAGIIHRDIKPENLFALAGSSQRRLKLLDFGISRHGPDSFPHREVAAANDASGPLLGTPAYMAPERILDLPSQDARSDIWSLGVVLHELLTQRSLFERADVTETCARVVKHRFELEGDPNLLPPPLRGVIARCLARRVVDRFQSVQELAAALHHAHPTPHSARGFQTGKYQRQAPAATARATPARTTAGRGSPAAGAARSPHSRGFTFGGRARMRLMLWAWLATAVLALGLALRAWL
jgi:serine/threonine-protein kinase